MNQLKAIQTEYFFYTTSELVYDCDRFLLKAHQRSAGYEQN